ncbi:MULTISPECIES: hypothetical protein [Halobacterium]|uniref:DUF7314 domain-containing protein n=4 Tax=Halobacterium salinarum TaxID=2242 RepID=Q9HRR5_HALSA|nr:MULTISPECIES: hypothetical protein [Halobacterium]AAG19093.1 hypothetical protein VNG_0579H [Halobacterium salinarum NRC-1]MBB6089931.1 hypothetical protein [Halobacterium salinarum]MCF2165659.1 hypothetical protein [Halobacterium salinarum]MCF2168935.1 hypothetical protein [Halobacterium salinarum]MCF2207853.1 hypothetical protein [Halobacterium salinarum]
MADEFIKGLGMLTGGGLVWMIMAGWYRTPEFGHGQLISEVPSNLTMYDQMAVVLLEGAFWVAIIGALFFWIGLPLGREAYATYASN